MQNHSTKRARCAHAPLSALIVALFLAIFLIAPLTPATAQTGSTGNGRILAGYWHDWETPVWIPLAQVPSTYDIIVVAFATYNGSGNFTFTVDPDETQAQFITDIQTLHSQGKKVLISLGGASETPTLASASDAQSMATSAVALVNEFGFDGIDIDFENGAVYLNVNDLNINAPTTPSVVYLISALKQFHAALPNAMVTMAPIANYMQAGYEYYGPGPYGDSNWNGAYLPVIQGISSFLSYVWPQYYNECNIEALDNNIYCEGTDGNLVGMSEMIMKGFPLAWSAGTFTGLNPDQVALGVPASTDASPGYLSNSDLEASFSYLTTGKNPAGTYVLENASGYPNTAGFMTWSINWDVYSNGGTLGTGIHAYLASLPSINGSSTPSFSLSAANATVTAGSTATSTVTETISGGYSTAVTLSASGLPTGVTAAFSPASITGAGTSKLTFTAASTAAAGSYTVTVTGTPASGTAKTTTLTLTVSSASTSTVTLSPASYNFGTVKVGTGTTWVSFTLTNSGTAAVTISNVAVTGPFVLYNQCGSSVAKSSSCTIFVYFSPTATGAVTGTLTVTDSATGSPQTSALSGTGD
ncbi:MAG: glycosyl hydrolase family 18 protein [Terracidiphilus sp.]